MLAPANVTLSIDRRASFFREAWSSSLSRRGMMHISSVVACRISSGSRVTISISSMLVRRVGVASGKGTGRALGFEGRQDGVEECSFGMAGSGGCRDDLLLRRLSDRGGVSFPSKHVGYVAEQLKSFRHENGLQLGSVRSSRYVYWHGHRPSSWFPLQLPPLSPQV